MTKVQIRVALMGILSTGQAQLLAGVQQLKHVEENRVSGTGLQEHFNNIGETLQGLQEIVNELPEPEGDEETKEAVPAEGLSGPVGEPVIDGTPPALGTPAPELVNGAPVDLGNGTPPPPADAEPVKDEGDAPPPPADEQTKVAKSKKN